MECPTIEDAYYIQMDIGCKAHFNHTILSKLQIFILECHPVIIDATCEWKYNNIVLGNSTETPKATHDGKHTFTVFPSRGILSVANSGREVQFNLPLKTPINCTCYSPTMDKNETRSTMITSPDFQDGK